jgi:hypothetical protein
MKILTDIIRIAGIVASVGLLGGHAAAADLHLPVNVPLAGAWSSTDSSERGRLDACLSPVGEGEYELWFKVTGSSIFNATGKPYPSEGVYPIKLERLGDDELAFVYRQPFPRIPALFFVPKRLTYEVRLEGPMKPTGHERWKAKVNDHNLTLTLSVRSGSIAGTYDYDGRWATATGFFRLTTYPRGGSKTRDKPPGPWDQKTD